VTLPIIYGHETVLDRLLRAATAGTPHHAYLFHGTPGIGRRQVALRLALALNCEDPEGQEGDRLRIPCGHCTSCNRILSDTDPDVWTLAPLTGRQGKTERKKTGPLAIRVDDIRELQGRLAYRATPGRWRVVIIDDIELMNPDASNCLLKTLEEPPERTVLVLITRRLGQTLATVRSRCMQIGFGRLSNERIRDCLVAHAGKTEEEAEQLSFVAGGSIGRALTLSPEKAAQERALLERFIEALAGSDTDRLTLAEELAKLETEARKTRTRFLAEFINALSHLLRDATAREIGFSGPASRPDCVELAQRLSNEYDAGVLMNGFDAVQLARDRMERNMSPRLVLEALLLEID